jgi:hypothetical protein
VNYNAPAGPQTRQINGGYNYAQSSQNLQPTQQFVPVPHGYPQQTQVQIQYQPQQPQYQAQAQPQAVAQPSNRASFMGGSGMMGKMSSKFTSLQKGGGGNGAPSAARPNGKAPADWKKWAKRGAIGVAGIGALALGVDAAGDMFSGAEAFAGGSDFTGGEAFAGGGEYTGGEAFSGGGEYTGGEAYVGGDGDYTGADAAAAAEAQAAIDANVNQHTLEMVGEQKSSMLLDPVGTECEYLHLFPSRGEAWRYVGFSKSYTKRL